MTPIEQRMAAQRLCMSENGFMAENGVYVQEMKTSLAMKRLTRAEIGGGPASYIPAHTSPAAAASFRT
ncbi:hypothetical protein JV33_09745 [Pectobacterium carotovorum subsp. carotovorum]|nr:hypothetical protein JV33_09745 [Pectobacterium carotovorum subsp. carotovorum]KML71345.1 hypothetical protein G032_05595 [Pectobacterium carotovorum subsp. carotovorum ICMP 5702]